MVDPVYALTLTALVLAVGAVMFWPERGYFWRWQHLQRLTGRVLLEDALKHLFNCEYAKQNATLESLSGALEVSGNRAAEILVRGESLNLLRSPGGELELTEAGREYALRIIRVHRLWEHYLAEQTGLDRAAWHAEAHEREHDLSPEEADQLAEELGHPVFDPDGDAIPTAAGEIAPTRGRPLTSLPVGELAMVVHLEDEPRDVYLQLIAEDLNLGTAVEVTEISAESVRFLADGRKHFLPPLVAANASVAPLPQEEEMRGPFETLAVLRPRERGEVVRISASCHGLERRRLMDLGIVPGTVIRAEMKSPGGDPTAYRIRGALIALRRDQAAHIHITSRGEAA